jgi:hypothetical protein
MPNQLERQIVIAKNMDIVDSAHLMALASVAEADAGIPLFETSIPTNSGDQSLQYAMGISMAIRPPSAMHRGSR